ncbi:hypothetical protein O9993_00840 [Vibrio lentus]|nr:hypothetical protein [Vibrio lentus]
MRMMSTGEQSDDGSKIQTVLDVVLDGVGKPIGVAPAVVSRQVGTGLVQQT